MTDAQKITLAWTNGAGSHSREFDVYSVNKSSYELQRGMHRLLNGGISEWNLGYRRLIDVDFAALDNDKFSLFDLYDFLIAGDNRSITFEGETWDVVPIEDDVDFEYMNEIFFANAFTLHFIERTLTQVNDTGIIRTLVPLYTPSGQGITGADGQVLSVYVNLVDDSSAELFKINFKSINGNHSDYTPGYRHRLIVDFGRVETPEFRQWLLEYCLWQHREIDTTQIDPVNGKVYTVVLEDDSLRMEFREGVRDAESTTLNFLEKTLRTETEVAITPPEEEPPIYDEVVADEKVIW